MKRPPDLNDVVGRIRSHIREQNLAAGAILPSARQFEQQWKISRRTIDRAILFLISRGELQRDGYKLQIPDPATPTDTPPACRVVMPTDNGVVDYASMREGIREIARLSGLHYELIPSEHARSALVQALQTPTQGILFWPAIGTRYDDLLSIALARKVPFVVCDLELGPFDFVGTDNEHGICTAVEYLASLGHRNIGYVTYPLTDSSLRRRQSGYQQACLQFGLGRSFTNILEVRHQSSEDYCQVVQQIRSSGITAILAGNLVPALHLRDRCLQDHVQVPQQISIIGFDRDLISSPDCRLTCIHQNMRLIGSIAMQRLIQRMHTPHCCPEHPVRIRVEPTLVPGTSTAPVAGR